MMHTFRYTTAHMLSLAGHLYPFNKGRWQILEAIHRLRRRAII
jgi:hypothetical protein